MKIHDRNHDGEYYLLVLLVTLAVAPIYLLCLPFAMVGWLVRLVVDNLRGSC